MRLDNISRTTWVLSGLGLRIALLGWGAYQDSTSAVPYTDIDYHVFTSAAHHLLTACPLEKVIAVPSQEEYTDLQDPPEARGSCAQGIIPAASRFVLQAEPEMVDLSSSSTQDQEEPQQLAEKLLFTSMSLLRPAFRFFAGLGNPYKRDTYRYTPLLAVLLTPGELLNEKWSRAFFGKALFILADIIVALLMWDIMDLRRTQRSLKKNESWLAGLLWLCNPFTAQISTRGSSESVLGVLVLAFLDMTIRSYPERNLLVEVVEVNGTPSTLTEAEAEVATEVDDIKWNNAALMAPFLFALSIHWKLYPIIYAAALVPHLASSESMRGVFRFGSISIYSLACISLPVWAVWGPPYLDQTFFYHFSRSDHRHNFSPHFLSAYLASSPLSISCLQDWPTFLPQLIAISSSLAFIPQLGLTAYLGFSIGSQDLVAAITFQTIAFVTLNKVCTSQYYMWIIWFLPIVTPFLHFKSGSQKVVTLVSTWVLAQVSLSMTSLLAFVAKILLSPLGHLAISSLSP
jgi:phosphatidylinositol glycan class M